MEAQDFEGGSKDLGFAHGPGPSLEDRFAMSGNKASLAKMSEIGHSHFRNKKDGFQSIEIP